MILSGGATRTGTNRYFQRLRCSFPHLVDEAWFIRPPSLDLTVSRIGFGTYRVHRDQSEHHEAIREALLSGFNVIDTAPNYSDGSAEILVGNVIQELVEAHRLTRDEIVLVDKVGFIEESTLRLLGERLPPETVELGPALRHSIHPDFIQMQFEWTRQRLGLEHIDFLLLHNPEEFLKSEGAGETEYFRRIRNALIYLEDLRSRGLISFYGISTNKAGSVEARRQIEAMLSFAPPGFRVLQFPANLVETGYRDNGLLDLARKHGLWTMANRPLNAIAAGGPPVLRLTLHKFAEGEDNPISRQMEKEEELKDLEDHMLALCTATGVPFSFQERSPAASQVLRHYRDLIPGPDEVYPLIQALTPPLQQTVSRLRAELARGRDPQRGRFMLQRYIRLIHSALASLPAYCSHRNSRRLEKLEEWVQNTSGLNLPLPVQAIQAVLAEGVQTVLVGMRRKSYVRQIQDIAALPSLTKIPDLPESLLPGDSGW